MSSNMGEDRYPTVKSVVVYQKSEYVCFHPFSIKLFRVFQVSPKLKLTLHFDFRTFATSYFSHSLIIVVHFLSLCWSKMINKYRCSIFFYLSKILNKNQCTRNSDAFSFIMLI